MSSRAAKILSLVSSNNKVKKSETSCDDKKNNSENLKDNLFSLEPVCFETPIDEHFFDNVPIVFYDINPAVRSSLEYRVSNEITLHQGTERDDIENEILIQQVEEEIEVQTESDAPYTNTVENEKIIEEGNKTHNERKCIKELDSNDDDYEPDQTENGSNNNSDVDDDGKQVLETDIKRKRKKDTTSWNREINKKLRMEGKKYQSTIKNEQGNKIKVPARKLGVTCDCNSLARSCKKVDEKVRSEIFNMFWKLDWVNKKNYVSSLVKYEEKKRCYVQTDSRRTGTFYYHLQVGNEKLKVCKKMFLSTLALKERSVRTWVTNPTIHGMPKCKDAIKKQQLSRNKTRKRRPL